MAGTFHQDQIAEYIARLLASVKKLEDEIKIIKREKRNVFGPPPVPYAGMYPALQTQSHDVVKIYRVDVANNYWEGQLCKPIEDFPFWKPDTQLGTISGVTPDMISVPEIDELAEVFFSGMYPDDASSDGLSPRYGLFDAADPRPGMTTSWAFPYPEEANTNVYEVQTLKASFPKLPGVRGWTGFGRDVVIAMNWVDEPKLLPQGTKVTVHRHNGQWWFRQRSNSPTVSTPGSCVITVVVTAYGQIHCCSPVYANTCTYTNSYTYITSCTSEYDIFDQTYITSCTTLTSITTITSCTTVRIDGTVLAITATFTLGSGCR